MGWLFTSCLLLSSLAPSANGAVQGTTTRLTTGTSTSTQTWPMISGTNVVWTNAGSDFDVYWMDVSSTKPAINLTNTPSEQEYLEDIDGTDVVFTRTSTTSSGDIVVYDTTTGFTNTVAASIGPYYYSQPAIRGRYVVYVRTNSQSDIDGYDNATGSPFSQLVTNDAALQARPRVAGDFIVWEDYRAGNSDIYGYQISTQGPAFAIATGSSNQTSPDIDGNRVVWVDDNGGDQIWSYDLVTKKTTQLTSATSNKVQPRISGSRVVWADDRAGNLDIYTYDFTKSAEDVMVAGAGDQMLSDIDGNRVVYTSNDTGFESVYLFTLSAPPPPVDPVPQGCDASLTTQVSSFTIDRSGRGWGGRSSYGFGWYVAQPGARYFVCVENGRPDGSARTSRMVAVDDWRVVVSPIDLQPYNNPPHWVAKEVVNRRTRNNFHFYAAALFGRDQSAAHVTVSLRRLK